MDTFLIALGIFSLRIVDVSIGTVRVIFTIRGYKLASAALGVVESAVWIFAISRVMKYVDNPISMLAWATGFATGTVVGIAIEQWIASGSVALRIISGNHFIRLKELLASEGFGVTAYQGQGVAGPVMMLYVVMPRRRQREALRLVRHIDSHAFIAIEPVNEAIGGYLPPESITSATAMRK